MAARPALPPQAQRLLALARRDRAAARQALDALSPDDRVALVCETPLARRAELLELARDASALIRRLPEAELCFTVKTVGLADAGWLLEDARDEQLQACLDLDAWRDLAPDREALDAWLAALAECSDARLVRAAKALDAELLVLWLRDRIDVVAKPSQEGWEPPAGARTLEGQFYLRPRRADDDLAVVLRLLHLLFQRDYWFYFRTMQGVAWESPAELEEYALRWRTARLQDLGFPSWEEAMSIYGVLPAAERAKLPEQAGSLAIGEWTLPVWLPRLPDLASGLFRAAAELAPEERRSFFYAFVALANQVAVADRLPLGEPGSLPAALEKAARFAGSGLEFLSREHALQSVACLRRVPLRRLFRIGFSLDRDRGAA